MAAWNDLLLQARGRSGLSQRRLAELAGVSEKTVENYEAGKPKPSQRTLKRLAHGLDFDTQATAELVEAAGFEREFAPRLKRLNERRAALTDLVREAQDLPWPCLINNERYEVMGWNAAVLRVAELDFAVALPAA